MRIGLNLLHAMPEIGGGWNYINRLVLALGECDQKNTYICFVTEKSAILVPDRSNFQKVFVGINPVSRLQRILYENTILQMAVRKYCLDLVHWFANTGPIVKTIPSVVSVYDLQVFENPANFTMAKRWYLRIMISYTVRNALMLLPMSQSTAQDLYKRLNANVARMVVIPPVIDTFFKPDNANNVADLRRKYDLPDKFWLYVAHFYSHKNHLRLIQAYHQIKSAGIVPWQLVLRGDDHGAKENVWQIITKLKLEKEIIFLPRLDEVELPALYSAASALVFPSLYEGCGMPVLEAMACGCPVIASDIPSIREYGRDAVMFFDPLKSDSITSQMRMLQENSQKRIEFGRLGIERVKEYRPECVVQKLLDTYEKVARKQ